VRCPGLTPVILVAVVESKTKTLTLFDSRRVSVAVTRVVLRAPFGILVDEKEVIGNIFVTGYALLRQVVGPSKELEYRSDQFLLGNGFIRSVKFAESFEPRTKAIAERGEFLGLRD